MNAFPVYAIWSSCLGTWLGGCISATVTTNKEKAIAMANAGRPPLEHTYSVIEIWGEGHYDRTIYTTPPGK